VVSYIAKMLRPKDNGNNSPSVIVRRSVQPAEMHLGVAAANSQALAAPPRGETGSGLGDDQTSTISSPAPP
jgi:hypothetical protein